MDNIRIDIIIPNDEKMDEFINLCNYLEANIVDENHSKNGNSKLFKSYILFRYFISSI